MCASIAESKPAAGPLRALRENPRYFTDGSGKAVYLVGAHTWPNLRDMGDTDPPQAFDWDRHLGFLTERNHNFIRLWAWDLFEHDDKTGKTIYKAGPGLVVKPEWEESLFERQDDWSSTVYFYLDRPVNGLPKLTGVAARTEGL